MHRRAADCPEEKAPAKVIYRLTASPLLVKMNPASDPSRLRTAIASTTGKSEEEIMRLVESKREKFSGLLTEAGATFMVARELGVQTGQISEETKISSLKEGMNNVDVVGRVRVIYPKKEFEKNGRKGTLQSMILWDGTAQIRATVWNSDVEKLAGLGLESGDGIKLANCSITSYSGALQLGLNYNSAITKTTEHAVPELGGKTTGISELEHGMNDVAVKVKIKKIFPAKEFENERGKGKVMNFIISEGVEEMRATAWNETVEKIEEIGEGEEVTIEGAYTKENRGEIELHLGRRARVVKENKE